MLAGLSHKKKKEEKPELWKYLQVNSDKSEH